MELGEEKAVDKSILGRSKRKTVKYLKKYFDIWISSEIFLIFNRKYRPKDG
jgi:hypothetical protein